ncbi:MAG TPA: hypothetical protein VN922_13040 [Bacteroidia bacterium]|nr:hypothetical protein [Bacteroidia bacterium]
MTVRAKFKVANVEKSEGNFWDYETQTSIPKEVQTVILYPVCGNSDENNKFFASTPAGSVQLSTINAAAGNYFEIGAEYYLDFTKAD